MELEYNLAIDLTFIAIEEYNEDQKIENDRRLYDSYMKEKAIYYGRSGTIDWSKVDPFPSFEEAKEPIEKGFNDEDKEKMKKNHMEILERMGK